jgi:hypothetical protein
MASQHSTKADDEVSLGSNDEFLNASVKHQGRSLSKMKLPSASQAGSVPPTAAKDSKSLRLPISSSSVVPGKPIKVIPARSSSAPPLMRRLPQMAKR